MPYSVIDRNDGEIFASYLSEHRAEREAAKDTTTIAVLGRWGTWLRFLVKTPTPFIVFVVACVIAAAIALA